MDSISGLKGTMGAIDFSSDRYSSAGSTAALTSAMGGMNTAVIAQGMAAQNKNLETQNNLLMQMVSMLAQGQNVSVQVDGREVARATSGCMDTALRKTRDSKSRARGGK